MGINTTEVAYGFGQFGCAITDSTALDLKPPKDLVIVAITALSDLTFDASGGLVADTTNTLIAGLEYIGTEVAAHNLSDGSETAMSGSEGLVVDSVTFPKGVTIYGRWTEIDVSSGGGVIAYIGE